MKIERELTNQELLDLKSGKHLLISKIIILDKNYFIVGYLDSNFNCELP